MKTKCCVKTNLKKLQNKPDKVDYSELVTADEFYHTPQCVLSTTGKNNLPGTQISLLPMFSSLNHKVDKQADLPKTLHIY